MTLVIDAATSRISSVRKEATPTADVKPRLNGNRLAFHDFAIYFRAVAVISM
jgi:hypothetical protein